VNFSKGKVSKAAVLASLVSGLLVVAPSPPVMQLPATVGPAALAYAEPPPLAVGLAMDAQHRRSHASATCANARHELRFEMITAEVDAYPPTWRNPAVCLAVYVPGR
jgi:hypothetical protein